MSALESVFRGYKTGELDTIAQMLGQRQATPLRAVSKSLKAEVERSQWDDLANFGEPIKGSLADWRRANPNAEALDLSNREDLKDADMVHVRGIKKLNISGCIKLTDRAFVNLKGIHTLVMQSCNQKAITDRAFTNLTGIHTLDMTMCDQRTITDAAFVNLRGIKELYMGFCAQETITDAAFKNLTGIHTLNMNHCEQPTITDAAFTHLAGIHTLNMNFCSQPTITDAAFPPLRGIAVLHVVRCQPGVYTSRMLQSICTPSLKELKYDRAVPGPFADTARSMFGTDIKDSVVKFQKCGGGGKRRRTQGRRIGRRKTMKMDLSSSKK